MVSKSSPTLFALYEGNKLEATCLKSNWIFDMKILICSKAIAVVSAVFLSVASTQTLGDESSKAKRVVPGQTTGSLRLVTDDQKFKCKNYICTCKIGKDCGEMFDTIEVVNCKDGAPGELECESTSKD